MQVSGVVLESVAAYLPPRVALADVVGEGFDPEQWASTGQTTVACAREMSAPEMAVTACQGALARTRLDLETVGSLLYSSGSGQGPRLWSPAAFVANAIGLDHAGLTLCEVQNVCNGLAGTEALIMALLGGRDRAGIVVSAERFEGEVRAGGGVVLGDGACCAILALGDEESDRGPFGPPPPIGVVRSIASEARPKIEGMHRGNQDLKSPRPIIDVGRSVSEFLASEDPAEVFRIRDSGIRAVVDRALYDAGVVASEVRSFVYSGVGQRLAESECIRPLRISRKACPTALGKTTGHAGSADDWATVEWLLSTGQLQPGDICCLIGTGAGYAWTCMVFQVLNVPAWAIAHAVTDGPR
jgi:3-oxoacyl-[acyl-carrier-protein] synthase-3